MAPTGILQQISCLSSYCTTCTVLVAEEQPIPVLSSPGASELVGRHVASLGSCSTIQEDPRWTERGRERHFGDILIYSYRVIRAVCQS